MRSTHPDPAVERLLTELEARGVEAATLARFAAQPMAREIAWILFGSTGSENASDLEGVDVMGLLAGSLVVSSRARAAEAEQLSAHRSGPKVGRTVH